MRYEYECQNDGLTIVVRGIAYDFPEVRIADAFFHALLTGTAAPKAATMLLEKTDLSYQVNRRAGFKNIHPTA